MIEAIKERLHRSITYITVLSLLGTGVVLQIGIDADRNSLGLQTSAAQSTISTTFKFLGGVRTAAAAYLWIKADRLHDDYYKEDFNKEQELVPLYRLATWLDPHLVDAYYVGSWLLYRYKQPEEGWKFAQEGLRLNPDSWKMELNLGQLAMLYKKNYREAVIHMKKATELAKEDEEKLATLLGYQAALNQSGLTKEAEAVGREVERVKQEAGWSDLKPASGSQESSATAEETLKAVFGED